MLVRPFETGCAYDGVNDQFKVLASIAGLPTPTAKTINSGATTNATSVKTSAGTVYNIVASNASASVRYLKLYNKASAPTVGTDVPILTVALPASNTVSVEFGAIGTRFTTGIACAITGAVGDTDTTAILASEVKVILSYV